MYQEKRPTCVTVIGWAWIIIGGLMCFAAVMGSLGSVIIGQMSEDDPEVPFIVRIFPFIAVAQIGVGALGLVSGVNFLKLKSASRTVLEVLSWLLLLFVIGFGIFWMHGWLSMTFDHAPTGFGLMGAIMGVVITVIYVIPLAIMLKYLRGDKVRNAMIGSAEQSLPPGTKDGEAEG